MMKTPTLPFMLTALAALALGSAPASAAEPASAPPPASEHYVFHSVTIGGGGFVTGIIFNPTEKGLVYVRTDVGGAYRRDTRSSEWVPLLDWVNQTDWNLFGVESLASDPVDPRRVYIAAGTYTNPGVSNGEILRSTDYGATWQRTAMPFKFGANENGRNNGERLAVDPNDNRVLYLGHGPRAFGGVPTSGPLGRRCRRFPPTTRPCRCSGPPAGTSRRRSGSTSYSLTAGAEAGACRPKRSTPPSPRRTPASSGAPIPEPPGPPCLASPWD